MSSFIFPFILFLDNYGLFVEVGVSVPLKKSQLAFCMNKARLEKCAFIGS